MQAIFERLRKISGPALAALLFGSVFVTGLAVFAVSQSILISAMLMALASLSTALATRELLQKQDTTRVHDEMTIELRQQARRLSKLSEQMIELEAELRDVRREPSFSEHARVDRLANELDHVAAILSDVVGIIDTHETQLANHKQAKPQDLQRQSPPLPIIRAPDPEIPAKPTRSDKPASPLASLQTEGILREDILGGKLKIKLLDVIQLMSERVTIRELQCGLESRLPEFRTGADLVAHHISPGVIQLFDRMRFGYAFELAGQIAGSPGGIPILCPIMNATFKNGSTAEEIVSLIETQQDVASRLIIAFDQSLITAMNPDETERIMRLSQVGARLALQVTRDFSFDPEHLTHLGFGYVLADATDILGEPKRTLKSEIHPADIGPYLERYGLMLVAQNVTEPAHLKRLKMLGIPCAGGPATMRALPERAAALAEALEERRSQERSTLAAAQTRNSAAPLRDRLRRVQA